MGLNRRDFLKIGGATLASMGLNGCVTKRVNAVKKRVDNIPEQQDKKHISEIIEQMKKNYPMNRQKVGYRDKHELNNLTHKNLYGYNLPKNNPGTFIQKGLEKIKFPETINTVEPQIFISNIGGKVILRFYIDGELNTACYVSPGLNQKGRRTPENIFLPERDLDIDHISMGTKREGAVMPYAIHISGGVWIHGSTGIINGRPRSHGCIRTGLFFVKNIYDTLESRGLGKTVKINTNGIY